jgi:hypothetical protein
MRSTSYAIGAIALAAGVLSGCGASPTSSPHTGTATKGVPVIAATGSRAREYDSLSELAETSSALVVATPTGTLHDVPLPAEDGGTDESAPTTYVQMRVVKVLSGALDKAAIDVVSPGTDERTGEAALLSGGPYLMYLTPAMYDAEKPAGGYAITGGPAGVYASQGRPDVYSRVDTLSPRLPEEIDVSTTTLPTVSHTEAELLRAGPQ